MGDMISLGHGGGGSQSRDLLEQVISRHLPLPLQQGYPDAAVVEIPTGHLAITTDSYVVKPLFFPGGDIGKLAVCGTVNDLAVAGARPQSLTLGLIIEEGFAVADLDRIMASVAAWSRQCGVNVVTGDTKVVGRGQADGIFLNTAGVGALPRGFRRSAPHRGDLVIASGSLGEHGVAILAAREAFSFSVNLESDCAPIHKQAAALDSNSVRLMRDPTRGGAAAVLNEWARSTGLGFRIHEKALTFRSETLAACELLGLDPLHLPSEGRFLAVVAKTGVDKALAALKWAGAEQAAVIGEVTNEHPGQVVMETIIGGERLIDLPAGELLPRIC